MLKAEERYACMNVCVCCECMCVCVFDNYCKKSRPSMKESLMGEIYERNYVIILILNINTYEYISGYLCAAFSTLYKICYNLD